MPLIGAIVWLVIVIIGATFAQWLAPYGPTEQSLLDALQGPSAAHPLGTDSLGRDILSRLMYGASPSLIAVAIAVALYTFLGTVLGLVAGYLSGLTDRAITTGVSIVLSIPSIITLFVVLSVYRGNTYIAMAVFGVLSAPVMVLLVRSSTLAVRNELYIDAARVSGLGAISIIFRHILPRLLGRVIVQAAVFAANAIVVESALSFLGFGAQPPNPTWGNLVADSASNLAISAWMLIPTGGVIALTALACGIVGDSVAGRLGRSWAVSKLTSLRPRKATPKDNADATLGALLSIKGLDVGYRDNGQIVPIVKNVSFDIPRGKTVGLVGESGSGKTTVAFGVLGVAGDGVDVTAGSVWFDGVDLTTLDDAAMAPYRGKRIGYVAQEPMVALDPNYRVRDLLGEAVRANDSLRGKAVQQRVVDLLRMVELPDPEGTASKYPHELSGGMAQRVSIAFAIAGRPELLVADEPTTALDVTVQAGILGLLHRLRAETGMSLLIITHDWGVVADICDQVVVMYRGEIVENAPLRQIFAAPAHPYSQALLASNPHGATPGHDLPVVTGTFPTPSQPGELLTAEATS